MPKVVGIIPARYGSTRFPGKPLAQIAGKTLLRRTYENALQASQLEHLIVATDDQRIFEHVQEFGGQAVLTSPHCPTGTDRLAEVLTLQPDWMNASAIVNIQGDEPCVNPDVIDQLIEALLNDPSASMSTAATRVTSKEEAAPSSVVKCIVDQHQNALYFSRALIPANRQVDFHPEHVYLRHLGLYAYRPSFLMTYQQLPPTPLQLMEDLEQLKALEHGYRIKVAIVDYAGVDVNHPEDINKVEQWLLCKQNTFL